jgi:hypothetical protein
MFFFNRLRAGKTEVFDILVPQDSLPNAETRFGKALRCGQRETRFHQVGIAVLIHDDDRTEYIVAGKDQFNQDELSVFHQQLEMLAGHSIHSGGSEPATGWFEHDELKDRCP